MKLRNSMKVLTSLFSELVYKNNPYFKTCFLTKKSIKNLLTTSKKFRVQLNIFLTNKFPRLADCSKLHFIKVQLHMAPLVIT